LRMEMALKNGEEDCVIRSRFAALDASKLANEFHEGTKRVLQEPNAGGKSFNSEALSFETLQALFGADNLITEMNVRYQFSGSSLVDYVCDIIKNRVGVSVTRAMHFQGADFFTPELARILLSKKLGGLDRASRAVSEYHAFNRQILHVWAQSDSVADYVKDCFENMPRKGNPTICLITVAERLERFVFNNDSDLNPRDPAGYELLKSEIKKKESGTVERLLSEMKLRNLQTANALKRISAFEKVGKWNKS